MQTDAGSDEHRGDPSQAFSIVNRQKLAQLVGILAMALPFLLHLVGALNSCSFDSISHYYYGPYTGTIFIGVAAMVSLALFAYSGKNSLETWLANLAAVSLVVLLIVPTQGVGCEDETIPLRAFATVDVAEDRSIVRLRPFLNADLEPDAQGFVGIFQHFALSEGTPLFHLGAAGVFIAVLAVFCFFIFTKIDAAHLDPNTGNVTAQKLERNKKYRQSGWVIVACLVLLLIGVLTGLRDNESWDRFNITFWLEAIAVVAFARSWLIKGRALMYNRFSDQIELEARKICD